MTGGFWRKNGVKRGVRVLLTTNFPCFWHTLRRIPKVKSRVNQFLINSSIYTMETRPPALSTKSSYTSWDSLHDREFSARHLAGDDGFAPDTKPTMECVSALFERPAGKQSTSEGSSLLFPFFAQWFVDGFLRTDPTDARKNTSTHDIDLSQLYGQKKIETDALRAEFGLLKTSTDESGREFPPLYYDRDGNVKACFKDLPIVLDSVDDSKAQSTTALAEERKLKLFALGLPRGNMHYGLAMMSTLFIREHNRIAREIRKHTKWDSDRIFETTRNTMIVLLIKVVIEDYINHITPIQFPLFMESGIGMNERWYRQNWMSVEFNLLYRWHSLVPSRVKVGGTPRQFSSLTWDTSPVTDHDLAALFHEASRQPCSTIDLLNTDVSMLQIEQQSMFVARKTQLASYNDYRQRCGLPRLGSIEDLTSQQSVRDALHACYGHIDNVEFFPGLFAEDVRKGATLPPLMTTMVAVDAFSQALTNPLLAPGIFTCDTFSPQGMKAIKETRSLQDIVRRNTKGESVVPHVSLARIPGS
ncbi:peroxidase family protein [Mycobacterium sp. 236(2023)]|uniref:peroxidase family protein n=1 Tax=Mycobacterium sp. 236(2023) TaxID=3038163 RepID=UPI0024157B02|nr:peroxidase family protein [Mycobacterium sp. 236(2023)]MDG4666894.1 peroxidase family protein [Mycobacterium sp. 236(2023)]